MTNRSLIALLAACIFVYSCSKGGGPGHGLPPGNNLIHLQVVSGWTQTDTAGKALSNPVVVKVTQDGAALSGYTVLFVGSGCNSDRSQSLTTASDGTASYLWRLAGDVGLQSLKVYAVNSNGQKVDSTTVTATGLAAGPGWHASACSVQDGYPSALCKLSTGMLFTSYGAAKTYLRYSNDNGASWYPVKSLGNTHEFMYVLSTPSDELFAWADGEGTFYSTDAGQTWTTLSVAPFVNNSISAAVCTPSGKLVVTSLENVYISLDKGKTWATIPNTALIPPNSTGGGDQFNSPTEDAAGNLYVVDQETETIFKSGDNGSTWTPVPISGYERDFWLDIVNNNWYKSRSDVDGGGIYISTNNGATFSQLVSTPSTFLYELSPQSDGNIYYINSGVGLFQSTGQSAPVRNIFDVTLPFENTPYIVAKNNNIIVDNQLILYYYQK